MYATSPYAAVHIVTLIGVLYLISAMVYNFLLSYHLYSFSFLSQQPCQQTHHMLQQWNQVSESALNTGTVDYAITKNCKKMSVRYLILQIEKR